MFNSLLTRMLAIALICTLFGSGVRYVIAKYRLLHMLQAATAQHQHELAGHFAQQIAQKIQLRQALLQTFALSFPQHLLNDPAQREQWLQVQQALLAPLFSTLSLELPSGQVLTRYPVTDQTENAPALSLAFTIKDARGQALVNFRGATVLTMNSFLGELAAFKNGQTGGFLLLMPSERNYIFFGGGLQQWQPIPARGVYPLLDTLFDPAQLNQAADINRAKNVAGVNNIFAVSTVHGTPWILAAYLPEVEVNAAFQPFMNFAVRSTPLLLLFIVFLAAIAMFYFLRPLHIAAKHADQMARGEISFAPLPVGKNDELGRLTRAFNRLLTTLSDKSKELMEQREMAELAASAKSRFLAAASHDLRQPMHALNLYLGALTHFDLPSNARPVLQNVRECAQTMDEMFRALLDISKLDASVMAANIRVFPIAMLLDKIQKEFVRQAEEKGLSLRVVSCSACVKSDPELVERIFRNLVSNAVRYTVCGKILVGCRRTENGIRLQVCDTGAGIAIDQQKNIFQEFYQANNPGRDREQGLGLGLAIVQRLAMLLRAPLALYSKLGQGSVFSITLESVQESIPSSIMLSDEAVHQRALAGALIAVVDDEILILNATRILLAQWGCSVISAVSGVELFDLLTVSTRVPDALVCDHRLGHGETGVDVITMLRDEFNCDIPALLITGDTSPDQIQTMLAAKLPILHKPLQEHILKSALLAIINQPVQE